MYIRNKKKIVLPKTHTYILAVVLNEFFLEHHIPLRQPVLYNIDRCKNEKVAGYLFDLGHFDWDRNVCIKIKV